MSPSVAPVRRSGSIARRNASFRAVVTTTSVSQRRHYEAIGWTQRQQHGEDAKKHHLDDERLLSA
jgi:hypothetical protein